MSQAAAAMALQRPAAKLRLTVRGLTAALLTCFAADNLLLLHFWGMPLAVIGALGLIAAGALWHLCGNMSDDLPTVPVPAVVLAFGISLTLLALGGEGRFFYSNLDWQIRDAVLRDLATNPWPFAYDLDGSAYFLRAPIGTYLLPAMFGGQAEIMLLAFNALRLSLLLLLGWHLFDGRRERAIGLATFILFSGWDVLGTALYNAFGANLFWDHIDPWNFGFEYSSNVTLAFWVPQHAIAGWTCALIFLLWRRGLLRVGTFAASIPLVAIWSPLAAMGAMPFALFAGFTAVRRKAIDWSDVELAVGATAVSLPALLYLQLDADSVGIHLLHVNLLIWLACIFLEVLPFTVPLLLEPRSAATDKTLVRIVQAVLLVLPFIQIGERADFQMRASVMPLAVLSILFAQWLCRTLRDRPMRIGPIAYALVALAIGAVTPMLEFRRAIAAGPSPRPLCSLVGVWQKQDLVDVPTATYLAPVASLPATLRDVPMTAGNSDPAQCWERPWVLPSGWGRRSD